jgi:pimeloyl-ACP methyl ester carboxylesterase
MMTGQPRARRLRARSAVALVLSVLMLAGLAATTGTPAGASPAAPARAVAPAVPDSPDAAAAPFQGATATPIVFVHGYLGSGAQYRSPAMRFASNGIPANRIRAFDYNMNSAGLDAFIEGVRQEFGVQKVHVAAHSLGTVVMLSYLLNATQAAKVDGYVALDGVGAWCFYGTRCTSISASSLGQTHIEASLSPESFARQFQHFYGRAPTTTTITPETGQIEIAGRALDFQVNTPATGATGQVWPINAQTGARTAATPHATFTIGSNGNFGPIRVNANQPYEITLTRSGVGVVHFYYQPFIRSTYLLRLQAIATGSPILTNTNFGPNHAAGVVLRYREWWRAASHGTRVDDLTVSTTSAAGNQPATNVLSRTTADVAGVHIHDNTATPRQSSLNPLTYFSSQAFQTGVDVYMPGATTPNGTITFANNPRGEAARRQVINIPNWASMINGTRHAFLVEFNDYVQ